MLTTKMDRSVLEIILFCTLAALHGKLSVGMYNTSFKNVLRFFERLLGRK